MLFMPASSTTMRQSLTSMSADALRAALQRHFLSAEWLARTRASAPSSSPRIQFAPARAFSSSTRYTSASHAFRRRACDAARTYGTASDSAQTIRRRLRLSRGRARSSHSRFSSSSSSSTSSADSAASAKSNVSVSERLKILFREYGWSTIGVYAALSLIDFPFCFLAVRWLGTERIGHWEHSVVEWIKRAIPVQIPPAWRKKPEETTDPNTLNSTSPAEGRAVQAIEKGAEAAEAQLKQGYDHGVRDADAANSGDNASIWTQLALAYAIHKSFIFVRVPLTAAVTPKVVKTLRGWGWKIGRRRTPAEKAASKAASK